jgi:TusA-related sulfurtransferase
MEEFTLDITRDHCPMTFVKTKLQLSKMNSGERVSVLLRKGEPLDNVPRSAAEQGYKVLEISPVKDGIYKVVIEK